MPEPRLETNLPSIQKLRAATSPPGVPPFRVGIVIGPGLIPMDMVGIQTVFGLMPGAETHLLWKSTELVEGFPNWWTRPTTTFADCPTHPPFGTGTAKGAGPELVDRFEGLMANMVSQYREGATKALQA